MRTSARDEDRMSLDFETRIRNVTAVLGPTNTGKTHLAIERMLGHETGLIGLPLRLLAREVYDKVVARVGADKVALITGEEKIKPERARYFLCTVEAMPREADVDFLAVDEIQLAADPERGHIFTDRLLHVRGRRETLLLGAQTMREAIGELLPGANFISRPRLSKLSYAGDKKITRLPPRSAVVAFSANDVYAIAELIRRQRGGAAVVLGALSPRTRNAQVALYQSGDVDFLVATDAIGMGLNLDVDHVAFAGVRKFDGQVHRDLTPAELGQIAGRAGRHMNDGTFGVTARVEPFSSDLIERLESHAFETVKSLQWRSRDLDFSSLEALKDSLRQAPHHPRLAKARMDDDMVALETVSRDPDIVALARSRGAVSRLWEVCQIPDYRKISAQNHADLVATLYKFLMGPGERIPEDWFAKQVAFADRTDGDIDTLATRIAHIRTWTFVSNRSDWLENPEHWQGRTRAIEDSLSDALHEQLAQRFVDRRTSALMRGLKEKDELYAEIAQDGSVHVEKHYVGRLLGLRFSPDPHAEGIHGRAARNAAAHVLGKELAARVAQMTSAKSDAFKLTRHGQILWRDEEVGRLEAGEHPLKPVVAVLADEHLSAPDKEKVRERLNLWIAETICERLKPLTEIAAAADITGLARGIAFRLTEGFGVLRRETVADEVRSLDQTARAQLRKYGVRFGAFNIYVPSLLKPAAAELRLVLWALREGAAQGLDLARLPDPPRAGLTSVAADQGLPEAFYRAAGFHVCGSRAVRIDILERLADLIRVLLAWRPKPDRQDSPPKGATGDGAFTATPEMMSILGCSADELAQVLKALGFRCEKRPVQQQMPALEAIPPPLSSQSKASAQSPLFESQSPLFESMTSVGGECELQRAASRDGPEACSSAPPAAAGALHQDASSTEVTFEEIWRPPRRGRMGRRHKARRLGGDKSDEHGDRATPQVRRARHFKPAGGRDGRRHAHRGKLGKDRGMKLRSAVPAKRDGVDPDSPFAALSALKATLEKRQQD
jgi:ATP-dependent RNA helicase SUPV3L1/SUV3